MGACNGHVMWRSKAVASFQQFLVSEAHDLPPVENKKECQAVENEKQEREKAEWKKKRKVAQALHGRVQLSGAVQAA